MNAIVFAQTGGPEVLTLAEVPKPDARPGMVLIRVHAIGVNFADTRFRQGTYVVKPKLPDTPGMEAAGVVEAVGEGVSDVRPGMRVAAFTVKSYADYCQAPASMVLPLPDFVSDVEGAAFPIQVLTAYHMLHTADATGPGRTVLVHSAAGGVGSIACQWLKHLGATVIGTVSSEEKAAVASAHGCDHPIVYTREDFADRVREITGGEGVAVVYDSVGKATFEASLRCLRRRGLMASFGEASGDPDPVPPRRLGALGSIYLTHPSVSNYTATRAELLTAAHDLFAMVAAGKIKIEISSTYPLQDAPRAHSDIESRKTTGSIVMLV